MQEINYVVNFAGSMFERFPQQIYATTLFALCCGLGLVGVVVSRKRSVRLQEQIDELRSNVRRLEAEEIRRDLVAINLSARSGQMHQEDASSIAPFSVIAMPAPLHAAPTSRHEPQEQPGPPCPG